MTPAPAAGTEEIRPASRWVRYGRVCLPTLRFWMRTEIHVYSFSIAANVLLSFFPFLIVMISLCRYIFKWSAAVDAIYFAIGDYFPGPITEYLVRNLKAVVGSHGPFQLVSVLVLLFTGNGVFEPLEVAFNQIWRCASNRSFFKNQIVSLGLIFACGGLILLSTVLTALGRQFVHGLGGMNSGLSSFLGQAAFKLAEIPASIFMLFLIYWLLPNCKLQPGAILPSAVAVGILLEILKFLNLLTWPYLRQKFAYEYGPFDYAATLVLWSFLASMLILAGTEWAARKATPSGPSAIMAP